MLKFSFAKQHGVLVEDPDKTPVTVLYYKPPTLSALAELRRYFGKPLQLQAVSESDFNEKLIAHYETDTATAMHLAEGLGDSLNLADLITTLPKPEDLLEKQDEAPIIRLLNALLNEAIKMKASDVHIETFEDHIEIRLRVDGVLHPVLSPPRVLAPLIISRIKVMARLDIAEKRLPQDGRMSLRIGSHAIDVRVAIMPTNHGERVVLRLLDQKAVPLNLMELGMDQATLHRMNDLILRPHGIVLVTGPTGSGKTTTLYAALTVLNDKKRNILTIEDPIEYDLAGIGQTQVNYKTNMTFAKGLRAMLRQDPDVVMVGEIRDFETAEISIQASLTGHLVLSTLHTNSAIGAVTRLVDMGVEPFLIASSVSGILAERLVRLLCVHCKKPQPATAAECASLHVDHATPPTLYHPVGCAACRDTGYRGRSGIYELIMMDETLRTMIHERASEQALAQYAHQHYPTLRQDGLRRVLLGETSLEEVWRVTE
jgi:general secretion pathway protein E